MTHRQSTKSKSKKIRNENSVTSAIDFLDHDILLKKNSQIIKVSPYETKNFFKERNNDSYRKSQLLRYLFLKLLDVKLKALIV